MTSNPLPIAVVGDRIVPAGPSSAGPAAPAAPAEPGMLQPLIRDMGVGALIVDAAGTILCANPAAQALFGGPPLEGRQVDDLLPQPMREAHRVYRSVFVTLPAHRPMGRYPYLWAQNAAGEEFCVQIELTPFFVSAGLWTAAVIARAPPEDC